MTERSKSNTLNTENEKLKSQLSKILSEQSENDLKNEERLKSLQEQIENLKKLAIQPTGSETVQTINPVESRRKSISDKGKASIYDPFKAPPSERLSKKDKEKAPAYDPFKPPPVDKSLEKSKKKEVKQEEDPTDIPQRPRRKSLIPSPFTSPSKTGPTASSSAAQPRPSKTTDSIPAPGKMTRSRSSSPANPFFPVASSSGNTGAAISKPHKGGSVSSLNASMSLLPGLQESGDEPSQNPFAEGRPLPKE